MELWKALKHLYPTAIPLVDYVLRDGSDGTGPRIAAWNLPQPQPTPAQITAAIAAYDAAQTAQQQAAQQLRQQVLTVATTAVGVSIAALNPAQVRALVAVLLHKEGALAADTTVRPLSEWIR